MKNNTKLFIACLIIGYVGLLAFNCSAQTVIRNDKGCNIEKTKSGMIFSRIAAKEKAAGMMAETIAAKQATTFYDARNNPVLVVVYVDYQTYEVTGADAEKVLFTSTKIADIRKFCKGKLIELL